MSDIIANRKGIILSGTPEGYIVEDNDLNTTFFHDVVKATSYWSFLVMQE